MNEQIKQVPEIESPLEMAHRKLNDALAAVEWGKDQVEKIQAGGKDSSGAEIIDIEMYKSAINDALLKLRQAYDDVFNAVEKK